MRVVAHYNESPERITVLQSNPLPLGPNIPGARAFLERQPIHLLDARLLHDRPLQAAEAQFVTRQTIPTSTDSGIRTLLALPLLREGTGIGTITIWRDFVEPFTERQIELGQNLCRPGSHRHRECPIVQRTQGGAEQQTATSEILGVIASSPTNIEPVLQAIAESATRLCEAHDAHIGHVYGDVIRLNAQSGDTSQMRDVPITRSHIAGHAILRSQDSPIRDLAAEPEARFPARAWRDQESVQSLPPRYCVKVRRSAYWPFGESRSARSPRSRSHS